MKYIKKSKFIHMYSYFNEIDSNFQNKCLIIGTRVTYCENNVHTTTK